jgi:hypothetical protein
MIMKLTIELDEAEVKGIKAYLKEVDGIEKPTKQDIQKAVSGELQAMFQSSHSSLADYIQSFGK